MDGQSRMFAPWRAIITLIFAASLLALASSLANAQFYVRSPDVEKGETEIEEHGTIYVGPGEEERLRQSHEVELKHGFTNRFELIVEGFFRQEIGENLEARQFEAGGQYEIIDREGDLPPMVRPHGRQRGIAIAALFTALLARGFLR